MNEIPFDFGLPPARSPADAWTARVPGTLPDRQALFVCLDEQLAFPGWWGWNWDALDDLLTNFSWIEHEIIVIVHDDVPLTDKDREIYLEILADAVQGWRSEGQRQLEAWFPVDKRLELTTWWQGWQRGTSA